MPILDVTLLEGRTRDKKQRLIEELTAAAVRALDVPPASVRVLLRDISPDDFAVGGVPKSAGKNS